MELLTVVLALAAVIIACVVYVALRNRRGSGERARFEPGAQEAPFSQEPGISRQRTWSDGGSSV